MTSHNRFTRTVTGSLIVLLTSVLTACGSSGAAPGGSTGAASSTGEVHLAMQLLLAGLPFTAETQAGAEAAAKELKVKLDANAPTAFDPQAAIAQVNNSLNSGVDGIAIADEPAVLWTRALSDAVTKTKGNTVAFQTVPAKGTPVKTYVGNDATGLGRQVASETIKVAGLGRETTGEVIIGICTPQSTPLKQTVDGMSAAAKELLPKADVLAPFNSQTVPAQNFAAWEQQMRAHPQAVLALGSCNQDGDSMIKAKKVTGAKFAIGSSDSSPLILNGIADGTVAVCVAQNWYVMGYTSIRLLTEAARNKTVPAAGWISPGVTVITKANVEAVKTRDASPQGQASFYQPIVKKQWADLPAATRPLAEIQGR